MLNIHIVIQKAFINSSKKIRICKFKSFLIQLKSGLIQN